MKVKITFLFIVLLLAMPFVAIAQEPTDTPSDSVVAPSQDNPLPVEVVEEKDSVTLPNWAIVSGLVLGIVLVVGIVIMGWFNFKSVPLDVALPLAKDALNYAKPHVDTELEKFLFSGASFVLEYVEKAKRDGVISDPQRLAVWIASQRDIDLVKIIEELQKLRNLRDSQ